MPITQDRMEALINAARIYQSHYNYLRDQVLRLTAIDRDKSHPDSFYIDACNSAAREMGLNPIPLQNAITIITSEYIHFRNTRKRNEYTRNLARSRRIKAHAEAHGDPELAAAIYTPRKRSTVGAAGANLLSLAELEAIANAPAKLEAERLAQLGESAPPKPTAKPLIDQTPTDPDLVDLKGLDLGL